MEQQTTTTPEPITVGSGDYYEALASRCNDLQADYRILLNRGADMEAALRDTLHPKVWGAVWEALELRSKSDDALLDMLAAETVRHMPGLSPALMLVWEHVKNITAKNVGFCCIGNGSFEEGHEPD